MCQQQDSLPHNMYIKYNFVNALCIPAEKKVYVILCKYLQDYCLQNIAILKLV